MSQKFRDSRFRKKIKPIKNFIYRKISAVLEPQVCKNLIFFDENESTMQNLTGRSILKTDRYGSSLHPERV